MDWPADDHAVLFDAASGDYWVVTESARRLLLGLQAEGPLPLHVANERLGLVQADATELIDSLARSGLLVEWVDGRAVALAQSTDDSPATD